MVQTIAEFYLHLVSGQVLMSSPDYNMLTFMMYHLAVWPVSMLTFVPERAQLTCQQAPAKCVEHVKRRNE